MTIFIILLTSTLCGGVFFFTLHIIKKKQKHQSWFNELESTLLLVKTPRSNDKKELSAEHMFASLHGILKSRQQLKAHAEHQEHIGFEIVSLGNKIKFYIWTPSTLTNFVEGQVYAQYPNAQIKQIKPEEDYAHQIPNQYYKQVIDVTLTEDESLPIKTFPNFEVDPLAAITATLTKLDSEQEILGIQILARPIDDTWHKSSSRKAAAISSKGGASQNSWIAQLGSALWQPPTYNPGSTSVEITERDRTRISAIEEKSRKLGYQVKIRILYSAPMQTYLNSRMKTQALLGAFKQFNTTNLNGFKQGDSSPQGFSSYKSRAFFNKGFTLNIEELASLYHLPHSNVTTPGIVWARARTGEPPSNLPTYTDGATDITPIGITNFRGDAQAFGLARYDRSRHVYIIGQTGVGKSGLLEFMATSDIDNNHGVAIIDPHGDFATNTLQRMPPNRLQDVIYFNPADIDFPIGFNPLETHSETQKSLVVSEIIGSLKKMFDSWGPRLEYILRYTLLSLIEYPEATMLDITKVLTDKAFHKKVVERVKDPVVRNFWEKEYASWNDKFKAEAVSPILNKIGAFTANPIIRNIVGQPKSGFNIRQIMDEGKILVINLSRGLIGEDNAAILGSLLVTKVQLAAMSRADIPNVEDRRPFYFYVDEFQNFATESFATILSEARKYGLSLTVANQYTSQMIPEVSGAVFGNVGSVISFRVSPEDANLLQKYFEPQFDATDLIQLNNRDYLANLSINGEKTVPFSARTIDLPDRYQTPLSEVILYNRQTYARQKHDVERSINGDAESKESRSSREVIARRMAQITITNDNILKKDINQQKSNQSPAQGEVRKKKTRRGKRGGRKRSNNKATQTANSAPTQLNTPSESIINLR